MGTPITKSKCPPECNICFNACPYKALTGYQWNIGVKREELINYKLCNQKRRVYLKTYHRKHSCGLCHVPLEDKNTLRLLRFLKQLRLSGRMIV